MSLVANLAAIVVDGTDGDEDDAIGLDLAMLGDDACGWLRHQSEWGGSSDSSRVVDGEASSSDGESPRRSELRGAFSHHHRPSQAKQSTGRGAMAKHAPPPPAAEPKPRRKPNKAAQLRLLSRTEAFNRKVTPSHDKNPTLTPSPAKQRSPTFSRQSIVAGNRLHSLAMSRRKNQLRLQETLSVARGEREAAACTFKPQITPLAQKLSHGAHLAAHQRLWSAVEKQAKNRIATVLHVEEQNAKECTFHPSLSRTTESLVRRSRSCEPFCDPGVRLYEDGGNRRVRQQLRERFLQAHERENVIGQFQVTQPEAERIAARLHRWGDSKERNIDAMREEYERRMRLPLTRRLDPDAVVQRLLSPSVPPSRSLATPSPSASPRRAGSEPRRASSSASATTAGRSNRCSSVDGAREADPRYGAEQSFRPTVSERSRQLAEELRVIRFGALFFKYAAAGAAVVPLSEVKRQVRELFPGDAGVVVALSSAFSGDDKISKEEFVVSLIRYEQLYGPQVWGRPSRENILDVIQACNAAEAAASSPHEVPSAGNRRGVHQVALRSNSAPHRAVADSSERNGVRPCPCSRTGGTQSRSPPRGMGLHTPAGPLPRSKSSSHPSDEVSARGMTRHDSSQRRHARRDPAALYNALASEAAQRTERRQKLVEAIRQREAEACTFTPVLNALSVSLSNGQLKRLKHSKATPSSVAPTPPASAPTSTLAGAAAPEVDCTKAYEGGSTPPLAAPTTKERVGCTRADSQSPTSPEADSTLPSIIHASLSTVDLSSESEDQTLWRSPLGAKHCGTDREVCRTPEAIDHLDLLAAIEEQLVRYESVHERKQRNPSSQPNPRVTALSPLEPGMLTEWNANQTSRSVQKPPQRGSRTRSLPRKADRQVPGDSRHGGSESERYTECRYPSQSQRTGTPVAVNGTTTGERQPGFFERDADSIFQAVYGSMVQRRQKNRGSELEPDQPNLAVRSRTARGSNGPHGKRSAEGSAAATAKALAALTAMTLSRPAERRRAAAAPVSTRLPHCRTQIVVVPSNRPSPEVGYGTAASPGLFKGPLPA